jgi:membrane-bound ClpP family serine protease
MVLVHGELWRARAPDELRPGDQVEVEGLDKEELVLDVKKVTA